MSVRGCVRATNPGGHGTSNDRRYENQIPRLGIRRRVPLSRGNPSTARNSERRPFDSTRDPVGRGCLIPIFRERFISFGLMVLASVLITNGVAVDSVGLGEEEILNYCEINC